MAAHVAIRCARRGCHTTRDLTVDTRREANEIRADNRNHPWTCDRHLNNTDPTDRQRLVLEFIRRHVTEQGYPPSLREIGAATGLVSPSSVAYQVKQLQVKGWLRQDPRLPRAVVIADPPRAGGLFLVAGSTDREAFTAYRNRDAAQEQLRVEFVEQQDGSWRAAVNPQTQVDEYWVGYEVTADEAVRRLREFSRVVGRAA